jgi:uncharacterized protein YcsI (UPF0317 family)
MIVHIAHRNPHELRVLIRRGELVQPTSGLAPGYVQANLVILPKELAPDFSLFCQRNPQACPLLEMLRPGEYEPALMASGADIRKDLPLYRIYKDGKLFSEEKEITNYWTSDLVCFLLGCSFTFESALIKAGISLRHINEGKIIPMYETNIATIPAGVFSGSVVVSMRPIHSSKVPKSIQITSKFPLVHGAPLHIGNPEKIGILDLACPKFGNPIDVMKDEVPVFWACGATSLVAAIKSKASLMITHSPGHMFITDILNEKLTTLLRYSNEPW